MKATIETLTKTYAHARTERGRVFVHQNESDFEIADCQPGDIIDVDVEEQTKGSLRLRAVWATWVERPAADVVEGAVLNVVPHRGMAFMIPDGASAKVFLHVTHFLDYGGVDSPSFSSLVPGQRVRCVRRASERGDRGYQIEVL